jgi:hypothetical protein
MSSNREIAERIARRLCHVGERILETSKPFGRIELDQIDEKGKRFGSWKEGEIADVIHQELEKARVEPRKIAGYRFDSFEAFLAWMAPKNATLSFRDQEEPIAKVMHLEIPHADGTKELDVRIDPAVVDLPFVKLVDFAIAGAKLFDPEARLPPTR